MPCSFLHSTLSISYCNSGTVCLIGSSTCSFAAASCQGGWFLEGRKVRSLLSFLRLSVYVVGDDGRHDMLFKLSHRQRSCSRTRQSLIASCLCQSRLCASIPSIRVLGLGAFAPIGSSIQQNRTKDDQNGVCQRRARRRAVLFYCLGLIHV